MPLDPKTVEALFAPGAGVRMHSRPLIGLDRAFNRRGREYHGRTVRQWCRLWGLDVSNINIAMRWEGRLRLYLKRQGHPEQFLAYARQRGWLK